MYIRRLMPADAGAFQSLWLFALLESPAAFDASYGEERLLPLITVERQLMVRPDRGIFGAFNGDDLIGVVTLDRENLSKLAHKTNLRNLYVSPVARGGGIARALLQEALLLAESVRGIQQVNLTVNADARYAVRFFESVGFATFGREIGAVCADATPHDKLHMALRLPALRLPKTGDSPLAATHRMQAEISRRAGSLYLVCNNQRAPRKARESSV